MNTILGKPLETWVQELPLLTDIMAEKEVFWANPKYSTFASVQTELSMADIKDAAQRLQRFAPYIAKVFPETEKNNGIIESPLREIAAMQQSLSDTFNLEIPGKLLLKCDSHLAISGSIKARGGIYEVLKHAEELAISHQLLQISDNYATLDSDDFRNFFSQYSIAVGSTGNLGLSIGIISAQLGFQVFVHMSADAKQWKKDLLREKGVTVVEYQSDYSKAVKEGRKQAVNDPSVHFIDDENSTDLFLGYAVAALRLKTQLQDRHIKVDEAHPLFVYLPCGVGGGPGGIAFGLKQIFKDHVHCFFAEPTSSPCMLLGLMTELHEQANVHDFGLNNLTDADGLAVGSPSGFVGKLLERLISGSYTVQDKTLYQLLRLLVDAEQISLEPSALAGMAGVAKLLNAFDRLHFVTNKPPLIANATHIVWATGGSMVPKEVMQTYYKTYQ